MGGVDDGVHPPLVIYNFQAEEIVIIADSCTDPHKARLQIDARKWYASKLAPKKYGDKLDLNANHTGTIEIVIGGDCY